MMYDLRGHGQSAKPHDPGCYSMDAHAGDVQALVGHLALDHPAVAGYSLGSMIAGRLLGLPWVSAAALCGAGSFFVEGEFDLAGWADVARCFSEGCWADCAAGRRRAAVPLPQAGGCSALGKSSAPRWPISAGSPASAAGSALSRRKCSEWLLPQTGARLSGGRPEPVKGAPSARRCYAPQTLDRTRPRVPRTL